ncbi:MULTISPECIES: hypothetical protein [unclassified Kitasatospora]|uniref:hypothetical protein n=1 Tax=unclassified Kitasatospora TaxID=2633591 RepID=UPI00340A4083
MTANPFSPDHTEDHPPVERLADLTEGLVDSPEAVAALRRHLVGCAECRETVDALAEVQALLGGVETPPMPADIADRLDAALAQAAAEAPAPASGNDRKALARPQEAPAAARRSGTPASPVRAATGPSTPPSRPSARPAAATGPGRPRPRRRFALLLGAAAALAALGLGGALLLHPDDGAGGPTVTAGAPAGTTAAAAPGRAPHGASAGTDYRADRLATQIQQLLARSESAPGLRPTGQAKPESVLPAEGARPEPSSPASPSPSASASPAPSASCPPPASGAPLATDRGSYDGAPVDVLVYPVPGRPDLVDVYLRAPDCGQVVLHQSVPSR